MTTKISQMIERVVEGEDAREVVQGLEGGKGREKDTESVTERAKRLVGEKRKRR